MSLMIERGIRGGICHDIHWYAKVNNKYTYRMIYITNKESLHLKDWNVNNLYGWAMSQKLPAGRL